MVPLIGLPELIVIGVVGVAMMGGIVYAVTSSSKPKE